MPHPSTAPFRAARSDPSLCVLEGLHAIKHAFRFDAEFVRICANETVDWRALADELAPDIAAEIDRHRIDLSAQDFAQLCPQPPHTGLAAVAKRPLADPGLLNDRERTGPIVILDNPTHPGNTGAVIRTAAAAGAQAVLTTGALDPWHPTTLRASAGLHFALAVARIDTNQLSGVPLIGLDGDGGPLAQGSICDQSILVFGSERSGLSQSMRDRLVRKVALPMREGVSSLNLAACVAIVLYQWRLHRQCPPTEC